MVALVDLLHFYVVAHDSAVDQLVNSHVGLSNYFLLCFFGRVQSFLEIFQVIRLVVRLRAAGRGALLL